MRKVQSLRHSLYVSWSSLDGLLVCLLWCGFSEFRVIRGSCGRIARNLVDSLHFPGFSGDGQRSETELRHVLTYCEMRGIHVIRVISGELSGILLIRSNFSGFSVDGQRSESQLHMC